MPQLHLNMYTQVGCSLPKNNFQVSAELCLSHMVATIIALEEKE